MVKLVETKATEGSTTDAEEEFLAYGGDGTYSKMLLQTDAKARIMARLNNNENRFRGFMKLALELMEVGMQLQMKNRAAAEARAQADADLAAGESDSTAQAQFKGNAGVEKASVFSQTGNTDHSAYTGGASTGPV